MEPNQPVVLIVEDHAVTRRFLADNLAVDGYEPVEAETAAEGLRMIGEYMPELAIVDLSLPDHDGLDLVRHLRDPSQHGGALDSRLPVLILSGRGTEVDRVRGFERGCDDYLVKPFSYAELRCRIGALLRRAQARPRQGRIRVGSLEIDPAAHEVRLDGERLHLSRKELALLHALASEPTRVFTREELLRDVWGFQAPGATRTLDSHACRLRAKLNGGRERFVISVWGVGYRLIDGLPAQ